MQQLAIVLFSFSGATPLSDEETMQCLQLLPDQVNPNFEQVYYLENIPVFLGGIRKDNQNVEGLYTLFNGEDKLQRIKIQSAFAECTATILGIGTPSPSRPKRCFRLTSSKTVLSTPTVSMVEPYTVPVSQCIFFE